MSKLHNRLVYQKFQNDGKLGWWDSTVNKAKGFAAEELGQDQWASHSPELVQKAGQQASADVATEEYNNYMQLSKGDKSRFLRNKGFSVGALSRTGKDSDFGKMSQTAEDLYLSKLTSGKVEKPVERREPRMQEAGFFNWFGGDDDEEVEADKWESSMLNKEKGWYDKATKEEVVEMQKKLGINDPYAKWGDNSSKKYKEWKAIENSKKEEIRLQKEKDESYAPGLLYKVSSFFNDGTTAGIPEEFKQSVLNPTDVKSQKILKETFGCTSKAECSESANKFAKSHYGEGYKNWEGSNSAWFKTDYIPKMGGKQIWKSETELPADNQDSFEGNRARILQLAKEGKLQKGDQIVLDRKIHGKDYGKEKSAYKNSGSEHTAIYMGTNEDGEVMIGQSSGGDKYFNVVPLSKSNIHGMKYTPYSVLRTKNYVNTDQLISNAYRKYLNKNK